MRENIGGGGSVDDSMREERSEEAPQNIFFDVSEGNISDSTNSLLLLLYYC